ncbi:hypothetical protein ASG35_06030 [Burkholderia sp. Leaf177]|uniref:hypothetical protein n=1 Tax=Burkholderia sp. Leaf177 TaxID=1736287 RepID=UPI0006FDB56A|nr:hypothetical protein [Burkholderia sp. Leaf177]KQR79462.1 hypothetical protein ASG35_06030 [Burkholderia sp. Leaf177]
MPDNFDSFNSFHDWIFAGFCSDSQRSTAYLDLVSDNFEEHKTVIFTDVTRCLVTDYGVENIVYSLDILSDFDSPKFMAARGILDRSTPFGSGLPLKKIAVLTASFGGEAWIEYGTYRVMSKDNTKSLPD